MGQGSGRFIASPAPRPTGCSANTVLSCAQPGCPLPVHVSRISLGALSPVPSKAAWPAAATSHPCAPDISVHPVGASASAGVAPCRLSERTHSGHLSPPCRLAALPALDRRRASDLRSTRLLILWHKGPRCWGAETWLAAARVRTSPAADFRFGSRFGAVSQSGHPGSEPPRTRRRRRLVGSVVYPPVEQLRRALYSPLSPAGEDGHAASGRGSRTVFRHQRARNRQ